MEDFVDFIFQKRGLRSTTNDFMVNEPEPTLFGKTKGFFQTNSNFNDPLDGPKTNPHNKR